MKIALVQDWLTELGGAEKVFSTIYELYPQADIYTLVYSEDVLKKMNIDPSKVTASFIQKLPFGKKNTEIIYHFSQKLLKALISVNTI